MVNPAGSETALRDFKTAALAQQKIFQRYAHVLEQKLAVAVRSVIVSKDGEKTFSGYSRRLHWDGDHGLLLVLGRRWIGLAHEDAHFAARIACPGAPPFVPVDHILI